jgi:general secretion pathway protein M
VIEQLLQRWAALAPRERRVLALGLLVVLVAVGYLLLFEPAWQGRRQIQGELPLLRGQLARMTALAAEAQQLAAAPRTAEAPQAMRGALEQSVRSAGLAAHLAQLNLSGELFDLRFSGVPYAAWLAWLDTTLRETRLRVADVTVTREANSGVVAVRLVLEAPRREGQ